ncbi:hypothetical protein AHiyo8_pI66820 (plasmid) [Arthrobacter sp. Hiyo8]|nr:hypothetical protein AHiyo8_pI66820 [Arthrobacter sp. Hiyo8]GAP61459.1 hypothetical protein AHiyo1_51610 [Arthrobacter sp. Hiyo1]
MLRKGLDTNDFKAGKMRLSVDARIRREWTPRVGEAAAAKLVRGMHDRFIQLSSAVFIFLWAMVPLAVSASIWTTLPALFRALFTAAALAAILFGMAMPGRRRAKRTREAAVCALNYLRATNYPRLTRLPYTVMRNPRAFDKYIGSIPSN